MTTTLPARDLGGHLTRETPRDLAGRLLAFLPPHLSQRAELCEGADGSALLRWEMGGCVVELDLSKDPRPSHAAP